jgi:hypothetical protein
VCKTKFLLMVLTLIFTASICRAESSTGSEKRLQKLEAALQAIQAELAQLKAEQARAAKVPVDQKHIDEMVSKAFDEKKADLKVPDWVNNVKIKGDLRYRHEWKDDESNANPSYDTNRHRIRARIGIDGKVNDEVDYGFRVASGNDANPTTTNQDLERAFSFKNIYLDLAYFDYHPAAVEGLKVLGGKMKNPYFFPGNSNLMFDTDVAPEGMAATYKTKWIDDINVFGTAGGYYVREAGSSADTGLFALQAGATYKFPDMEKVYVTAGGGYFDYGNIEGKASLTWDNSEYFAGNKNRDDAGTNVYDSDFDIAQAFGEVGFPVYGLPFKVFGEYLNNTNSRSSEDTGYLVGASIGKCKEPGSWKFAYNYRNLEADAVIGALTEGTFAGGGTNVKGHALGFGYQLAKNVQLGTSYFIAERTDSSTDETTDHDVVLVDLKFKF